MSYRIIGSVIILLLAVFAYVVNVEGSKERETVPVQQPREDFKSFKME